MAYGFDQNCSKELKHMSFISVDEGVMALGTKVY